MTARSFTLWVNDYLLQNATLASGAPRKISVKSWEEMASFDGVPSKTNH